MDGAYDHNLLARLLLTAVTAFYGIGLIVADANKTHMTNPLWTPHARFHIVWQTCSYTGFAGIAWYLIWARGAFYVERLYLVAAFTTVIVGAFFVALATMRLYGGANYDVNGHQPKSLALGGTTLRLDANTTVFAVLVILLVGGVTSISG